MKKLGNYFLQGLILIVPLAVTLYVIHAILSRVDRWLGLAIPGLGLLITIGAITLIGFFASNYVAKNLLNLIDRVFARLPLVKMLYGAVRDLIDAFVGDKRVFNRPVLVNLGPAGSIGVLGFLTKDSLDAMGLNDRVAVYLPQSYNFAGNLIIVGRDQVTPLQAASNEVMAFIVSAGVSTQAQ